MVEGVKDNGVVEGAEEDVMVVRVEEKVMQLICKLNIALQRSDQVPL